MNHSWVWVTHPQFEDIKYYECEKCHLRQRYKEEELEKLKNDLLECQGGKNV